MNQSVDYDLITSIIYIIYIPYSINSLNNVGKCHLNKNILGIAFWLQVFTNDSFHSIDNFKINLSGECSN
ncbi:uncharacterized protein OCT59_016930 [Rhizophagus irregularis]|uniref:Uncharacterized protein n=1 Tax=Rhizophagus irregularis TaxID=588596 RepID=A0A915Z6A9_9GLOM|nr:hypothetical protein OCT59_016930 [Rhizophagus irregularis]CAB5362274.1 unnamed protein product [Rhizophagus irregularis]